VAVTLTSALPAYEEMVMATQNRTVVTPKQNRKPVPIPPFTRLLLPPDAVNVSAQSYDMPLIRQIISQTGALVNPWEEERGRPKEPGPENLPIIHAAAGPGENLSGKWESRVVPLSLLHQVTVKVMVSV
jgi:hypothetical protein